MTAVSARVEDPRTIYNYPVVPETTTLDRPGPEPVTRGDLGTDFRNALSCTRLGSKFFHQVFYDCPLASATWTEWYGNVEQRGARFDPEKKGQDADRWEQVLASHADQGLFIMFNSLFTREISKRHHDRVLEMFGKRFIGHDEGEWDGHFVSVATTGNALGKLDLDPGRSRRQACEEYFSWMGAAYERHHNYMATTSSMLFGLHYAAELGSRMLGLELGERLPSDTLMLSFCRGACKQYDLLMMTYPAVFSVRGVKVYPRTWQPESSLIGNWVVGPEHGTTLGLLKREWWCSYMSGASLVGIQFGLFPTDICKDKQRTIEDPVPIDEPVTEAKVKAHLTPLGWMFHESRQAAAEHPMRGVQYAPVAVMLHHDHGWYPQPNIYAKDVVNRVWGNIPYNAGDWQTDRFFDWVYPGYKLSASHRDERGKIVNTPYGDVFDVILSNAGTACLNKYRCVVLLGSWRIDSEQGLEDRLTAFVKAGGTIIADSSQWPEVPQGAEAAQGAVEGLLTEYALDRGRLVRVKPAAWDAGPETTATFPQVLKALAPYLEQQALIEVEGRPVYHAVNVTDEPDTLLITLCNNSHALPWEGTVRVRGQEIVEMDEWLAFGEAEIVDGALRLGVPANDVRIVRVRTAEPFVSLRFSEVPWRDLGYGVPE